MDVEVGRRREGLATVTFIRSGCPTVAGWGGVAELRLIDPRECFSAPGCIVPSFPLSV